MKKYLFLLLFPLTSIAQNFTPQEIARWETHAARVTVVEDNWGVPHIYGKTDADAVFGLLYVQCEQNFQRVELNNLEMMGRLSEVTGKKALYDDLKMKMIYDSSAAIMDYNNSAPWFKKLLDAAADGVNFFLYKHPETKPAVLKRFEPWFTLLRTNGSISATQTGGITVEEIRKLYKIDDASTSFNKETQSYVADKTGSNGFAVSPLKTQSKNAILYINPHTSFYYRTEVQMISEEGLNAYGGVTWGTFFVFQGFNEHCGWMHTSGEADVADLFIEKIEKKGNDFTYLYDGKVYPVKTKQLSVNYKQDGALHKETFTTYATVHGPVMGIRNGQWLALREANRSLDALMQSWLRTKAAGFADFKKIMELRANASDNTVFADDKGNIAYWHGNFIPKRNPKLDYSQPVDGTTSASDWKGLHPLDEIVHVYNPKTGWIQNCNSTPFTVSGHSSPKKEAYPTYMAPDSETARAVNAIRLLGNAKDITLDKMIAIGYDRYLSAFDVLLPPLFKAYNGLEKSDPIKQKLEEAVYLLQLWDKYASASSVATTLAVEWAWKLAAKTGTSQAGSMVKNPTASELLALMTEVLNDLERNFKTWKVAWGDINRYQRTKDNKFNDDEQSWPVALGPGTWGSIPSFSTSRANTKKRYGVHGNSFVAAVEFGKKLKAKTILVSGESFDPSSKHFTDQATGYIEGKFKDINFYKEDVLKKAERTYHPGE
ncbi:MAG: penicillin amidase [Flavisolibacter sp.]|nr:penicillin amidase [Flavisolibacter sp.]